jgi:type IV pilus assembly protein PilA
MRTACAARGAGLERRGSLPYHDGSSPQRRRATTSVRAPPKGEEGLPIRHVSYRQWPYSRGIHPGTRSPDYQSAGFTLIEVLVVLAILGIVAAIVIMNVAGFTNTGAVNAANTEAHQVQSAVIAYMQTNQLGTWSGVVGEDSEASKEVERFLLNPGRLQARYVVTDGAIAGAFAYPDGKWASCTWDTQEGGWRRAA